MANRLTAVIVFILAGAATGGCAAAGLAAGPLVSAVQVLGDRAVERTVPADLATATAVVETVLSRSAFVVDERTRAGDTVRLRGAGAKLTVHAVLERATASMTRVSFRIETGGLLADRQTGEHLQNQVALALAPPSAGAGSENDPAYREALATLQSEVRQLRSILDQKRAPAAVSTSPAEATAAVGAPAFTVNQRGIVNIPESYGLTTVWQSRPMPGSVPVTSAIVTSRPAGVPPRLADIEPPTRATSGVQPLSPAGLLTPVAPIEGASKVD